MRNCQRWDCHSGKAGRRRGRALRTDFLDGCRAVWASVRPTAPFTEADWTIVDAPGVTPDANSKARQIVPELGRELHVDTTLTRETLHMTFMPATDAAAAMAQSLIELKVVS